MTNLLSDDSYHNSVLFISSFLWFCFKKSINFGKYYFWGWHVKPACPGSFHCSSHTNFVIFFGKVFGENNFEADTKNLSRTHSLFFLYQYELLWWFCFSIFFEKVLANCYFGGWHIKPVQDPWDLPPLFPNYLLSVLSPPPWQNFKLRF